MARQKERLAEAAKRKKELENKHDEELQRVAKQQRALHECNQLRKATTLETYSAVLYSIHLYP